MDQHDAERAVIAYLNKLYGFALAGTAVRQDAEDLAQEIALKLYRALLVTDVENMDAFVRRVERNALANYYRGKARSGIGICIDELADVLPAPGDPIGAVERADAAARLRREIAYLSKLQRQIVIAYYYEGRKQEDIASALSVPLGTVKWHLFEAKKELKKGMETMRNTAELKFNPIKFDAVYTSGSVGTKGPNENFLRSALSQNIVYAVWREGKTVNELADCLGVSPVFVESEAEYLEEYGFLARKGGKYLANILIDEPSAELLRLQSGMFKRAAKLFANALFDALDGSDVLGGEDIVCPRGDRNFLLWAVLPYVMVVSGKSVMDQTIPMDEITTLRPDGGNNLCFATVRGAAVPEYDALIKELFLHWNTLGGLTLWGLDSEWSGPRNRTSYQTAASRDLSLFDRLLKNEPLSPGEYAYMAERGYLKAGGAPQADQLSALQIVWIKGEAARKRLLDAGDRLKASLGPQLDELKAPYVRTVLAATPEHLRRKQAGVLQQLFYTNGWFQLYCLKELVGGGRLKPPAEEQKKSLTTLILSN